MVGQVVHISCPSCGATLGAGTGERLIRCRHCGSYALIESADHVRQYFISPAITNSEAHRRALGLLKDGRMPERLGTDCRFESARLYMVPFYELSGKRTGTYTQSFSLGPSPFHPLASYLEKKPVFLKEYQRSQPKITDTRVIMADVFYTAPAVRVPEWGLNRIKFEDTRSEMKSAIKPFKWAEVEALGHMFAPQISAEEFMLGFRKSFDGRASQDKTELTGAKLKLVFYPIWRLKYGYQGRLYGMTVDGATGRVLAARAPARDSGRIFWLLITLGIVTLGISKLVRLLLGLSIPLEIIYQKVLIFTAPIVLFGGVFVLGAIIVVLSLLASGWDRFRYSREIIFNGDSIFTVSIDRPPITYLDRSRDNVFRALKAVLRALGQIRR